jgi:hypothetical protein
MEKKMVSILVALEVSHIIWSSWVPSSRSDKDRSFKNKFLKDLQLCLLTPEAAKL